jgi:hypothetical protein
MKHKKTKLSAILFLGLGLTLVEAQNAIPATGGNASGTGGTASQTIGQVVYITISGTNGTVTQGVQQPYEISVVDGIKEALGIVLEISVYPNPTADYISLKIENYEVEGLRYQVYDINGSLLQDNKVEGIETSIIMSNYVNGTYF